jgi:hypothetical protein
LFLLGFHLLSLALSLCSHSKLCTLTFFFPILTGSCVAEDIHDCDRLLLFFLHIWAYVGSWCTATL